MKHDEFIGHVQNRAALPSRGDAERLTRIEVLMEAASPGELKDVLSQLPGEFGRIFVGTKGPLPSQNVPYDQIRSIQESLQAAAREKEAKAKAKQAHASQVGEAASE
jgi:uncharacterized protein (DUF2267 family)